MKTFIALLSLLVPLQAYADNDHDNGSSWNTPKTGIWITPDASSFKAKKTGEPHSISGEICRVWIGSSQSSQQSSPSCLKIKDKNLELHFFYPDFTSEVSSQVGLDKQDRKIKFNYNIPAISGSPTFTVLVGYFQGNTLGLMKAKAKLEKRIQAISERITELQSQGGHAHLISDLQKLKSNLASVVAKINLKLSSKPEIIAQYEIPLQVDNQRVSPSHYFSDLGGFRFDFKFDPGQSIEGDKAWVSASITNLLNQPPSALLNGDDLDDDEDGDRDSDEDRSFYHWSADLYWQGVKVKAFAPQALPDGQSLAYSFSTEALSPESAGNPNLIQFELFRNRLKSNGNGYTNKIRWGKLKKFHPVSPDNVAPIWLAGSSIAAQPLYAQNMNQVFATVKDDFGLIDPQGFEAKLNSADISAQLQFIKIDQGQSYQVQGDLNPLAEGDYTISLKAKDLADNFALPNPLSKSFHIDRTKPVITLGLQDGALFNHSPIDFPVAVLDASPVQTTVKLNDQVVSSNSDPIFNLSLNLKEGINSIEVSSTDAAGNVADVSKVNLVLDTTPPILSQIVPSDHVILDLLNVPVSGQSNEALSYARANGQDLSLSADKTSFSGILSYSNDGNYSVTFEVADLAGNVTTISRSFSILVHVLYPNLISVAPAPNQEIGSNQLAVIGAPRSTWPNASVSISTGFFSGTNLISNPDGSFQVILPFFQTATISVSAMNRTETATLNFQAQTLLSGVVEDTEGRPLAGATVSLVTSPGVQPVFTDSAGVFTITQPVVGDQRIRVDATGVRDPCQTCGARSFTAATIPVTLGLNQNNVLQRPIYMSPAFQDGTQVQVIPDQTTVVTSPHAPDVILTIPAGATSLPSNAQVSISMSVVSSDKTTLRPPQFAMPDQVVSFEPSGLTFNTPVALTMPNRDNLPAGTNVVVLSLNSATGQWEPDGVAVVDSSGSTITTKDGAGITHFSQVFMAPIGPRIAQVGAQDKPGANLFDGALSLSVQTPSYKVNGSDISQGLTYRSAWAKPTVLLTNTLTLPSPTITATRQWVGYFLPIVFAIFGVDSVFTNTEDRIVPESVTAQFFTTGIASTPLNFGSGILNNSTLSYAMDVSSLQTGVYPYQSHYDIRLARTVISTQIIRKHRFWLFGPLDDDPQGSTTITLKQLFPEDLGGPLYVQNKMQSEAGRGWRINGPQRIYNLDGQRVMLEESDGAISSYTVNNEIETLFDGGASNPSVDLSHASFDSWPNVFTTLQDASQVVSIDLTHSGSSAITLGGLAGFGGTLWSNWRQKFCFLKLGCFFDWTSQAFDYSEREKATDFLKLPNGNLFVLSQSGHSLYQNFSRVIGSWATPPTFATFEDFPNNVFSQLLQYCQDNSYACNPNGGPREREFHGSTGSVPASGWGGDTIQSAALNSPSQMAVHPTQPLIAIADRGNHRVMGVSLQTGAFYILAGNGQTYAKTDGVSALQSSLVYPQALAYDPTGTLFIATGEGYIRKVDVLGNISTVAGLPDTDPAAIFGDDVAASSMSLRDPKGLLVDPNKGILYVADTGHSRVMAVDLGAGADHAVLIAGSGQTSFDGDQRPAIQASLNTPTKLGLDPSGNLLIADSGHNRIRRVNFTAGSGATLAMAPVTQDNTKLYKNSNGTWTRTYRNGNEVQFDASGRQILASNLIGETQSYSYDIAGNLIQFTDEKGKQTHFNYAGGYLSEIMDPANRSTRFTNSGGLVTGVTYPDGSSRLFSYDSDGKLIQEINPNGQATQYTYNSYNRLSQVIRPDGFTITVNDMGSATAMNNFTGGNVGQLKPLSAQSNTVTDSQGKVTSFKVNSNGYLAALESSDGKLTLIKNNFQGKPLIVCRNYRGGDAETGVKALDTATPGSLPCDSEADFTYDSLTGDLLSQTDSRTGITTSQQYDTLGNVINQTNARGKVSTRNFSLSTGLLLSETDPVGRQKVYSYFAGTHLPQTVSSVFGATVLSQVSMAYDSSGNMSSSTDALNNTSSFSRDLFGNVTASTNALGQITRSQFDLMNRLVAVTTPKNETTAYSYTPTGQLSLVTDPFGKTIQFQYNNLDQLTSKTDQSGFRWTFAYDVYGNRVQEVDPNGNSKSYVYDSKNRLTSKILPDNTYSMAYDDNGNMLNISDQGSLITTIYDTLNRPVSVSFSGSGLNSAMPSLTLNATYDNNGNRIQLNDSSGGATSYLFDDADRLVSLTNTKGEVYGYSYSDANRQMTMTRPGVSSTYTLDTTGFLTSIVHSGGSSTLASFTYSRDAIGNRTAVTSLFGQNLYGYDLNNQLISATNPEIASGSSGNFNAENFSFDSIGNRTTDQIGSLSYDANNQRLIQDYKYLYVYDNNGNLITKTDKNISGDVTNYSYTSENQLVSFRVYVPGNLNPVKEVSYAYDALGRRIQKQVVDHLDNSKSFVRKYAYDGQEILLEYDGSNQLLARYTHSNLRTDDVLAVDVTSAGVGARLAQSSGSYQYLKDAQGTITDVADNNGNKLQHHVYSAFGILLGIKDASANDVTENPPLNTSYTYTGREKDKESGLYYYRARFYDPNTGRFLQKDPEPGKISQPNTIFNSYTYCGNAPGTYVDPSGEIFGIDDLIFLAIIAGSGAIAQGTITGNWSIGNLFSGAVKGLGLGAGILGTASLIGAGIGAVGGTTVASGTAGAISGTISLSPGLSGAIGGLLAPGTVATVIASGLAVPAAVGLFDPNASLALKNYALSFLLAGAVGNFLTSGALAYGQLFGGTLTGSAVGSATIFGQTIHGTINATVSFSSISGASFGFLSTTGVWGATGVYAALGGLSLVPKP